MHSLGLVKEGSSYTIETKAGILDVGISFEGLVYLSQAIPQSLESKSCEEIAIQARIFDGLSFRNQGMIACKL